MMVFPVFLTKDYDNPAGMDHDNPAGVGQDDFVIEDYEDPAIFFASFSILCYDETRERNTEVFHLRI